MAFCSACGAQIADGTTICPACSSKAGGAVVAGAPPAGAMADNVAGMLAYFTPIPSIIFLVTAPYNKSRFVRFHSFQNLFFFIAMVVIWFGFLILDIIPGLIFLMFPIHMLVWLAAFILWIILVLKANQGQMWKLPVIGDLAEKQANV
jgi:uncharacterized membrane protein